MAQNEKEEYHMIDIVKTVIHILVDAKPIVDEINNL